jgi:hypothetical protein
LKARGNALLIANVALIVGAIVGCSMVYDTSPLTKGSSIQVEDAAQGGTTHSVAGSSSGTAGQTAGGSASGGAGGTSSSGGTSAGNGAGGTLPEQAAGAGGETGPDCSVGWYPDSDRDGYGDESAAGVECGAPGAAPGGDCDDDDFYNNPGLAELCDGRDNDCDDATPDECPLDCLWHDGFEEHLYLFCWWPTQTWEDARALCASQFMRLVRIDSEAKQNYVAAWHDPDDSWLGGSDADSEGTWSWEDGEVFWDKGQAKLYSDWDVNEPNNLSSMGGGPEQCLVLKGATNHWNDSDCSYARPFTCERY